MPATCDVCGDEFGYDEVIVKTCSLGYEHSFCKKCNRKKDKKR